MELGITILDLKITEYQANKPESIIQGGSYQGKTSLAAGISEDAKLRQVTVSINATVFLENDVKNLINLGHITSETTFSFSESVWNERVKKDGGNFSDNNLDTYLIGISYDSLRGLLRERAKDDFLGRAILPLINPADITRVNKSDKLL